MTSHNARDRAFLERHRRLAAADERPARGSAERIEIAVELRAESDKAWRVFDGAREVWIPKSQATLAPSRDGTYALTCPEWLAKDKGLI